MVNYLPVINLDHEEGRSSLFNWGPPARGACSCTGGRRGREELEALLYQTRLRIEENQKDEMLSRLNKDLEFIEGLFEVNADGIEPLYHVIDLPEYLREDVQGETLSNEVIMSLCRSGEYGYIVVPAVPAALENSEHQAKKS